MAAIKTRKQGNSIMITIQSACGIVCSISNKI